MLFLRPYMFYRRYKLCRYLLIVISTVFILDYFGVFLHFLEKDFYTQFKYPYDGDIKASVRQLRNREKPDVPPINFYNHSFISNCEKKCKDSLSNFVHPRVVYLVKSSIDNFEHRLAIRKSWGYENRFSDVLIKTVFLLGTRANSELQERIVKESQRYHDIVQADFYDSYFNNTIKTMIGYKWAVHYCPHAKFYMFVDDDMYVSTKNVLRFIRNPTHYPDYLTEPVYVLQRNHRIKREINVASNRTKRQIFDFELPDDVKLYAGYVITSRPARHKSSKWFITLEEYPYHMWPSYVTAGAYILSREALKQLYFTSFYTKHFRFDDIYLSIVAMKAQIEPFHCDEFYFLKKQYTIYNYHFVIASHGYDDTNELLRVWNEQKSIGNA